MEYLLGGLLITCVRIVHPVLVTHLARETSTALFCRHAFAGSENPNGIPSPSPRVARNELPWVIVRQTFPTATRLWPIHSRPPARMISAATPLALVPIPNTHPRQAFHANLGLELAISLGLFAAKSPDGARVCARRHRIHYARERGLIRVLTWT